MVFVSGTVEAFDSSSMGQSVVEFAKKIGPERIFTPMLLRKTASTVVTLEDSKIQEVQAQLIEHNLSTEVLFSMKLRQTTARKKGVVFSSL